MLVTALTVHKSIPQVQIIIGVSTFILLAVEGIIDGSKLTKKHRTKKVKEGG